MLSRISKAFLLKKWIWLLVETHVSVCYAKGGFTL